MRKGIYKDANGVRTFDLQKILGKSYNNGWFTNTSNCRYRLFKGARNTKKSYDIIGYESVIKMIHDDYRNILILRRYDTDNRNTTFSNICKCINDLGLESYFKTRTQPLEIEYRDGRKIMFAGMNNPTSLNSIACKKGFLTDVYIEEAFEIESWDAFVKLDQSVRAGLAYNDEGELVEQNIPQQITMCFNAWSDQTWLYTEFFKGRLEDDPEFLETHKYLDYLDENFVGPGGTGLYMHISTYKCNEFRNRSQVDVAANVMKGKNYDYYKTLYLGCWGAATSCTYPEFKNNCIVPYSKLREFPVYDFAIGIDTGLSNGEGKKIVVKKGEDVENRVKSATVAELVAVTRGFEKAFIVDEYYHSNDTAYSQNNTDTPEPLDINQLATAIIGKIIEWMRKYVDDRRSIRGDMLMKGTINCYIDSADIGFRQILEIKAREMGLFNITFMGSTKTSIQGRVDFERLMFSYNDLLVCENCPNLIREFKNSHHGRKGEARENLDDHAINSFEYGLAPFRNDFAAWKTNFKEH